MEEATAIRIRMMMSLGCTLEGSGDSIRLQSFSGHDHVGECQGVQSCCYPG